MTSSQAPGGEANASAVTLLLLMALTALGQMATNLVVPALDRIVLDLAMDAEAAGLILSVVLLGLGLGQLVVGPLSDRYGRRPVLLGGLLLYVLAGLLATLAVNGPMLLAARLAQGLGASAGLALPRAIARDRFKGPVFLRVMSLLTLSMAVMPGLAPILGGAVSGQFGWRLALCLSAATGLAVLLAVVFALPESHHQRSAGGGVAGTLQGYGHVLRGRAFLGYSLAAGFAIGGAYAEIASSLRLYHGEYDWNPGLVSVATASYPLGFLIGGLLAPRLGLHQHRALPAGIALMLGSPVLLLAIGLPGTPSPWLAMALIMLSQLGVGFMAPAGISLALLAVEGHAGTASAVMGALHMVIGALGAALANAVPGPALLILPMIMLGMAVLAALSMLLTRGHGAGSLPAPVTARPVPEPA